MSGAAGVERVIVGGTEVYVEDVATGERPGKLLRAGVGFEHRYTGGLDSFDAAISDGTVTARAKSSGALRGMGSRPEAGYGKEKRK